MGQRERQGDWRQDDREGGYGNRSSYRSGQRGSEQGWGSSDREQDWRRTGQSEEGSSRGYSGGYSGGYSSSEGYGREGRGGESMRRNIEDNWRGQGGGSSSRDYDYGYGRSGVSGRDYEHEQGGRGYYGGGMGGGGMRGYTGGDDRGGGLGSNYSDYPRSEERYRGGGDDREGGWLDGITNKMSSWFGGEDDENRYRESRRGKGPKGYTRSDDRIKEDINDRLTDHYALDASEIDIEVNGGEIILNGTVESRYEKRLAEDVVESVSGVKHVENRLRVSQGSSYGMSTGSSETSTGTTSSNASDTTETSDTSTSTKKGRSASAK